MYVLSMFMYYVYKNLLKDSLFMRLKKSFKNNKNCTSDKKKNNLILVAFYNGCIRDLLISLMSLKDGVKYYHEENIFKTVLPRVYQMFR